MSKGKYRGGDQVPLFDDGPKDSSLPLVANAQTLQRKEEDDTTQSKETSYLAYLQMRMTQSEILFNYS